MVNDVVTQGCHPRAGPKQQSQRCLHTRCSRGQDNNAYKNDTKTSADRKCSFCPILYSTYSLL